jgi:hypothetical protein
MRDAPTLMTAHEATRIVEAGWRSQRTCCPDAVVVPCVCLVSVQCPRHGIICAGSHD